MSDSKSINFVIEYEPELKGTISMRGRYGEAAEFVVSPRGLSHASISENMTVPYHIMEYIIGMIGTLQDERDALSSAKVSVRNTAAEDLKKQARKDAELSSQRPDHEKRRMPAVDAQFKQSRWRKQ